MSDHAPGQTSAGSVGPQDSRGFLLWRATLRWQRLLAAALRPLELTHVQFVLLATVWWLSRADAPGEPPSQREVAAHAGVDVMMTSQVLRALEARGLVVRAAHPTDARARQLSVTEVGRRLAEKAVAVVEAADDEYFTSVRDHGQLLDVLHQLAGTHSSLGDNGPPPTPPT